MNNVESKSVNLMLNDSVVLVNRETVSKNLVNAPNNPCIIIYLTKKSATYYDTVYEGLHKYWGNRTDFIPQLIYSNGKYYDCNLSGNTSNEVDIYEVIENIRSYKENVFEDKKSIKLYFYLDTFNIQELDSFTDLFDCVEVFNSIKQVKFLTMLFYIEDASIKPQKVALREKCAELITNKDNKDKYNSLVWLGTNLYGGDVLKDEREAENYLLSSSMIFLSNNNDEEGVSYRGSALFSRYTDSIGYTVSYVNLSKPIKAIVANTYVSILRFLMNEMFQVDKKLTLDKNKILSSLGIGQNEDNSLLNEIYERIITNIPRISDLSSLPNIANQSISISKRDGVDFSCINEYLDRITLNCWNAFYNYNYIRVIKELLEGDYNDSNLRQTITQELLNSFNYIELSQLVESKAIEAIEEFTPTNFTTKSVNSLNELDTFIKRQIKNDIFNSLKNTYKELIREVDALAEHYIESLELLAFNVHEQAKIKNDDLSGNISSYYENIVRTYMSSSENMLRISKEFGIYRNDINEVYVQLSSLFSMIIESNPIYKASFEEELNARLNAVNAGQANKLIAKALQNPTKIKDNIRINSSFEPYELNTYYLINGNSDYVNILDVNENSIVNTGGSNSAETVVIYACSKDNITLR